MLLVFNVICYETTLPQGQIQVLEQSPVFRPQSPSGFIPENGLEVGEDRLMEMDKPRATGSIIKV